MFFYTFVTIQPLSGCQGQLSAAIPERKDHLVCQLAAALLATSNLSGERHRGKPRPKGPEIKSDQVKNDQKCSDSHQQRRNCEQSLTSRLRTHFFESFRLGRITTTTGHGHKLAICTVVQETLTARNAILILSWFVPILPSQNNPQKNKKGCVQICSAPRSTQQTRKNH